MQLTIHLSAQSRTAIRPHDRVSPRINQIIERYQAILAAARSGDRAAIVELALATAASEDIEARQPA